MLTYGDLFVKVITQSNTHTLKTFMLAALHISLTFLSLSLSLSQIHLHVSHFQLNIFYFPVIPCTKHKLLTQYGQISRADTKLIKKMLSTESSQWTTYNSINILLYGTHDYTTIAHDTYQYCKLIAPDIDTYSVWYFYFLMHIGYQLYSDWFFFQCTFVFYAHWT